MAAPIISSEALPSTPAHEWANETLNSVPSNTDSSTTASAPSTATTPGLDFPGAYPKTPSTQIPLGNVDSTASNPTGIEIIAEQAKQASSAVSAGVGDAINALPDVRIEGVKEALFNATVTASQYLPPKVVEYFPGGSAIVSASQSDDRLKDAQGVSLPSTEHGTDPYISSQGVGSLPGPPTEEAVAQLPLERDIESQERLKVQKENYGTSESLSDASMIAQYGSSVPTPTLERTPIGDESVPSHLREDLDQKVPPSSSPTYPSRDKIPTAIHLTPRTHPLAASGVGAHWRGVPLDEEYQKNVVDQSLADTHTSSTAVDAAIPVSSIPPISIPIVPTITSSTSPGMSPTRSLQNYSTIANVGHDKLMSDSEIPSTPSLASKANTATTETELISPVSTSSPLKDSNHAKNVSLSSAYSASTGSSGYEGVQDGVTHDRDTSATAKSANSSSPSGTPSRKKTNLLTKLKGEAKIISGKLGGKEEKVEEGKRLMRGE